MYEGNYRRREQARVHRPIYAPEQVVAWLPQRWSPLLHQTVCEVFGPVRIRGGALSVHSSERRAPMRDHDDLTMTFRRCTGGIMAAAKCGSRIRQVVFLLLPGWYDLRSCCASSKI